MASEITTLSEVLIANIATKRSWHRMFTEVISQIAALSEDSVTPAELAEEQQFSSLCFAVWDWYSLVPIGRNALESFGWRACQTSKLIFLINDYIVRRCIVLFCLHDLTREFLLLDFLFFESMRLLTKLLMGWHRINIVWTCTDHGIALGWIFRLWLASYRLFKSLWSFFDRHWLQHILSERGWLIKQVQNLTKVLAWWFRAHSSLLSCIGRKLVF